MNRFRRFFISLLPLSALAVSAHVMIVRAEDGSYIDKKRKAAEEVLSIGGTRSERVPSTVMPSLNSLEAGPTANDVDSFLRSIISSNLNPVNEDTADGGDGVQFEVMQATSPRKIGDNWIATYKLRFRGVELSERSDISSLYSPKMGRSKIRQRNTPKRFGFDLPASGAPTADINADAAVKVAVRELQRLDADQGNRVKPVDLKSENERLQIWVDPQTSTGFLAWAINLQSEGGRGFAATAFRVWVNAKPRTGQQNVFDVQELVIREHFGAVLARIWDRTPLDGERLVPLPNVQIIRTPQQAETSETGEGGVGAATSDSRNGEDDQNTTLTDENGVFEFAGSGTFSFLAVKLRNKHFFVKNAAGSIASGTTRSQPTTAATIALNEREELKVAQPSAFYWGNQARAFAAEVLTETELTGVELLVNAPGACNASWNSHFKRITLLRGSVPGGAFRCVNRAYRDTVFHEFGHALDFAFGGIQDGAYSEGFGDSLAILLKGNSCYGENSRQPGVCLRSAVTPPVIFGSGSGIHQRGRTYSGFTWNLVQELAKTFSRDEAVTIARRLTLQAAVANPTDIENAVALILDIDDDDLDLTNGTPHSAQIIAAADSRGIPLPAVLRRP